MREKTLEFGLTTPGISPRGGWRFSPLSSRPASNHRKPFVSDILDALGARIRYRTGVVPVGNTRVRCRILVRRIVRHALTRCRVAVRAVDTLQSGRRTARLSGGRRWSRRCRRPLPSHFRGWRRSAVRAGRCARRAAGEDLRPLVTEVEPDLRQAFARLLIEHQHHCRQRLLRRVELDFGEVVDDQTACRQVVVRHRLLGSVPCQRVTDQQFGQILGHCLIAGLHEIATPAVDGTDGLEGQIVDLIGVARVGRKP